MRRRRPCLQTPLRVVRGDVLCRVSCKRDVALGSLLLSCWWKLRVLSNPACDMVEAQPQPPRPAPCPWCAVAHTAHSSPAAPAAPPRPGRAPSSLPECCYRLFKVTIIQ